MGFPGTALNPVRDMDSSLKEDGVRFCWAPRCLYPLAIQIEIGNQMRKHETNQLQKLLNFGWKSYSFVHRRNIHLNVLKIFAIACFPMAILRYIKSLSFVSKTGSSSKYKTLLIVFSIPNEGFHHYWKNVSGYHY